jgi:hypothetical protein
MVEFYKKSSDVVFGKRQYVKILVKILAAILFPKCKCVVVCTD